MKQPWVIAKQLHEMWVGPILPGESYNLERIHTSMLQEARWNRQRPTRCTPACARETRGHLILLGKVRKALEVSRNA